LLLSLTLLKCHNSDIRISCGAGVRFDCSARPWRTANMAVHCAMNYFT